MKGTIIGTDLLEQNGDVKILEINTNTTIYNDGADFLDYDSLFTMLVNNSITEFHFIWTESDSYKPLNQTFRFKQILEQKCGENNITFSEYTVPRGSVTVPFVEDAPNKFILRQSFDTTALVDETYCADKFEFFNLMSGSTYIPNTYFNSTSLSMDTLTSVDLSDLTHPNLLVKPRNPEYDQKQYPEIYTVPTIGDLESLKSNQTDSVLLQEFVYSSDNLVDGRYAIIRSIDIIYGGNLDVINMGGYKQSTIIPVTFSADEYVENTFKLNQKSRYKYITKELGNFASKDYHTDQDSMILSFDGTLKDVDTIQIGDMIKSIDFVDSHGNHGGKFEREKLELFGWEGTVALSNETLTTTGSTLNGIVGSLVDTIYIRITTADGKSWVDAPSCTYYIEEVNSTATRFEKLNKLVIGDKLIVTDSNTQQLTTLEITGLEMEHANMTIYSLDFEPSDLFLVDFGDGDYGVMHNSCWCPWNYCGHYCNSSYCPGCFGGYSKL